MSTTSDPSRVTVAGVTEDDLYKALKFDARVQDYTADGDVLKVSVTEQWIAAPPGMQERSVNQWYVMWQSAHGAAVDKPQPSLKVIVEHDGKEVGRCSTQGYQVPEKPKSEDGHSEP